MKESQTVEFKKSLAEINEILETISAFANTKGGKILVGVGENKDGTVKEVVGITIKGKEIENLTNEIKQNTDPVIFPSIDITQMEGKDVVLITLKECDTKPVFAKGNTFMRVGKTNRKLSVQEIRRMTKESIDYSFTELPCEEATLKDIDLDFVKNFIKQYERIFGSKILSKPRQLLQSLGCLKNNKLANAGLLLFSKNPQKYFPYAIVAVARYKGNTVGTEKLDYKEFSGNVFDQIDKTEEYIKNHIALMSQLHPHKVQREDIPEYPLFAIRELVVNAVAHRDYAERGKIIIKMFYDRIEYYNPGGLPGSITPKNIINMQKSRNPTLVRVLNKLKYIEELGEGWDRIMEEYKNHSLKPKLPDIKDFGDAVLVTIYRATLDVLERFQGELNQRQVQLLEYLKSHEDIKSEVYAQMFGVTDRQARADISKLVSLGLLLKEGKARLVRYKPYPEVSGSIRNK
ncbi:putative DNA binding domain-containing protein [Candidatus Woesearchaeota archaeon]|nr:putative DNA binding domain-containing protein [Candidatus Woesearchaeota archaeon]